MKKMIVLAACMVLVATAAFAGILNSNHDMRTHLTGMTIGYNEVCVYCHTPHASRTVATTIPLWNRNDGTTVFTPYSSSTLNATVDGTLGGGSLACMSCHDGTIAIDSLFNVPNYGTPGTDNSAILSAAKNINAGAGFLSTDLRNSHPIGFTYSTVGDAELIAIATVRANANVRLFGAGTDQVECASCHDVHDTTNPPFLRASNINSQQCLACHNK